MKSPNSSFTSNGASSSPMIYVVDDEPMLLELANVILTPLGYVVKTFRDPESALRAFGTEKHHPALVITDYSMHSMNGLHLIEACRKLEPGQKFLMISGTVDEHVYRNSSWKPDCFLAKPYQTRQLVDAVAALLAQT
jgi:DNA-binding NtrC family response regulator